MAVVLKCGERVEGGRGLGRVSFGKGVGDPLPSRVKRPVPSQKIRKCGLWIVDCGLWIVITIS